LEKEKEAEFRGLRPNWNIGRMEYWNDGFKARKKSNIIFCVFATHYSIIATFQHSIWKVQVNYY
jgi:hypothetical protein